MTFCLGILTIIIRNYIWLHLEERTKTLHAECDKTTYKYTYIEHLLDLKKVCNEPGIVCFCLPAGLGGELCAGPECRPALRGLALSRAEDLRAELLRAEHLKAEALWEESSDGSRQARTTIVNIAR